MDIISLVGKGDSISADTLNRISAEISARNIVRNVPSGHLQQRSGGTVVTRKPSWSNSQRRGGIAAHPFKVINASTTGPAAAKVRIKFGQVNSITPTISAVALDNDPAPTLSVVSGVVYLKLYLDTAGSVVTVGVFNAATLPTPTVDEGYITLATVTVVSNAVTAINQSVTASLQYLRCNDVDIFGAV